jgi:hypothetical protein
VATWKREGHSSGYGYVSNMGPAVRGCQRPNLGICPRFVQMWHNWFVVSAQWRGRLPICGDDFVIHARFR